MIGCALFRLAAASYFLVPAMVDWWRRCDAESDGFSVSRVSCELCVGDIIALSADHVMVWDMACSASLGSYSSIRRQNQAKQTTTEFQLDAKMALGVHRMNG